MRIGRIESAWGAEALRPAVGWKVWRVDEEGRLLSVLYGDLWPVDEPVRATCRRVVHSSHEAPARGCECGIHAGREQSLAIPLHRVALQPLADLRLGPVLRRVRAGMPTMTIGERLDQGWAAALAGL